MRNHSVLIEKKTKRAKNDEQKGRNIVVFKERYYVDLCRPSTRKKNRKILGKLIKS